MSRIGLRGARNVRDLGGIATRDGRKLTAGTVFRGDALTRLDDEDLVALAGLDLRTVVDFRSEQEITAAGPDRLPEGVAAVALPIDAGDLGGVVTAAARDTASWATALGDGRAAELMCELNRQFVAEDGYRASFAAALAIIADPDRRPVLFHCTAGKDRTGWTTAVLLTALGVSRDVVTADYLATNDYVWPVYERWVDRLVASGRLPDRDLLVPVLRQDAAYLDAAFAEVADRYGDFDTFLTEGLRLSTTALQRLRADLLN
jgi:protein-tyrosine phosphatase